MRALPAVCILMIVLGISACDDDRVRSTAHQGTPAPMGTVEGRLIAVGGPAPGRARPMRGSVRLTREPGVEPPARRAVGRDGRFSMELPPGRYRALGQSPDFGHGHYACFAERAVAVSAGHATHLDVVCPMR